MSYVIARVLVQVSEFSFTIGIARCNGNLTTEKHAIPEQACVHIA